LNIDIVLVKNLGLWGPAPILQGRVGHVFSWSVPGKSLCQILLIWAQCFFTQEYNVSKILGSLSTPEIH